MWRPATMGRSAPQGNPHVQVPQSHCTRAGLADRRLRRDLYERVGRLVSRDAAGAFSVSPRRVALTFTRTQRFTAHGPGSAGVIWFVDGVQGGTPASGTITS